MTTDRKPRPVSWVTLNGERGVEYFDCWEPVALYGELTMSGKATDQRTYVVLRNGVTIGPMFETPGVVWAAIDGVREGIRKWEASFDWRDGRAGARKRPVKRKRAR